MDQITRRQRDRELHLLPQAQYADWTIRSLQSHQGPESTDIRGTQHIFWNHSSVIDVLEELQNLGCKVQVRPQHGNIDRIEVDIEGNPDAEQLRMAVKKLFPILRPLTRAHTSPQIHAGHDGINQLLLLALLRDVKIRGGIREHGENSL